MTWHRATMRGSTRTSSHASERALPRPNISPQLRGPGFCRVESSRFLLSDFRVHFFRLVCSNDRQAIGPKKIRNLQLTLHFDFCRRSEADVLREFLQGFESTRQGGVVSFSEFERYFAINTVRSQQPRHRHWRRVWVWRLAAASACGLWLCSKPVLVLVLFCAAADRSALTVIGTHSSPLLHMISSFAA